MTLIHAARALIALSCHSHFEHNISFQCPVNGSRMKIIMSKECKDAWKDFKKAFAEIETEAEEKKKKVNDSLQIRETPYTLSSFLMN